ncbi:MAG: hypothetical protein EOO41_02240 [Methanobacteriota archaeon]|nr:MAG: hypothetical protein EOO41_02240 [Euryarchaeota archaeon]
MAESERARVVASEKAEERLAAANARAYTMDMSTFDGVQDVLSDVERTIRDHERRQKQHSTAIHKEWKTAVFDPLREYLESYVTQKVRAHTRNSQPVCVHARAQTTPASNACARTALRVCVSAGLGWCDGAELAAH